MSDQNDVFLRESDAFSWYMERDPILRSTIVAVAWLAVISSRTSVALWSKRRKRIAGARDAP